MRMMSLVLASMLLATGLRADVVALENLVAASDLSNTAGQGVDLTFSLSATSRFSKLHLFRSAAANINVEVQKNGSGSGMPSDIAVAGVSVGGNEYEYTLTNIGALDFTSGDNWLIRITLGQSGFEASSTLTLNDPLGIFTTKNESSLQVTGGGPGYVRFQLYASAVPEPGTFLFGSLAAVSGGAGVWWKRRTKTVVEDRQKASMK